MFGRSGWRVSGAAALVGLAALAGQPRHAGAQARATGKVETELRVFPHAPQFSGQQAHMASTSLEATLDMELPGGQRLTVSPFIRFVSDRPADDPVIYFRSLAWSAPVARWNVAAGIQTVRWGSMRLNGPVDIVNQLDRSFHPFSSTRIGQPMLRLTTEGRWGGLELMAMSRVATRTQARREARLRGPSWVETSHAEFGQNALGPVEVAGRWSLTAGVARLGLSGLVGTSRDPRYIRPDEDSGTLLSVYESMSQVGLDATVTRGPWVLKAEGAVRRVGESAAYAVTIVGVDRRVEASWMSALLTAEYVRDSRGARATSKSQDDLYLEAKARTRGAAPVELSGRLLVDRGDGSTVWTVALARPLAEHWLAKLATWQFHGSDFASFRRDGYISASIQHSF